MEKRLIWARCRGGATQWHRQVHDCGNTVEGQRDRQRCSRGGGGNKLNVTVETTNGGMQTELMVQWDHYVHIKDYGWVCFMTVKRMVNFICLSKGHVVCCSMQLQLIMRKNHYQGTMLCEIWQCPWCREEPIFENKDKVKLAEVAQGAAFSRPQPSINLDLLKRGVLT
jgi:hypothetical protein